MLFDLLIEPLDDGGFLATSPDVQGLIAQGETIAETIDIARDVARKIVESCIEHGDPLPKFRRIPRRRVATTLALHVPR